jgi:hypothetical protein
MHSHPLIDYLLSESVPTELRSANRTRRSRSVTLVTQPCGSAAIRTWFGERVPAGCLASGPGKATADTECPAAAQAGCVRSLPHAALPGVTCSYRSGPRRPASSAQTEAVRKGRSFRMTGTFRTLATGVTHETATPWPGPGLAGSKCGWSGDLRFSQLVRYPSRVVTVRAGSQESARPRSSPRPATRPGSPPREQWSSTPVCARATTPPAPARARPPSPATGGPPMPDASVIFLTSKLELLVVLGWFAVQDPTRRRSRPAGRGRGR